MDIFKQGMKGPTRPAPAAPGLTVNRYSPVTNWNDDPFGADVFEPTPQFAQKKKPPPRPPPPKINKQPDIPAKPSHFLRKPTVITSLLSRKKNSRHTQKSNHMSILAELNHDLEQHNEMFPKCEPKNVQTGALIDLSSPPSSPTFTTRSSSESVDSFGSDATTSTNHHNALNGGSTSQAESGFEDDFDLFLHSRKPMQKEDTFDDFTNVDPFSPQPVSKPPVLKKPILSKELFEASIGRAAAPSLKGPTIIRAKPARPKPPDNTALLRSTFGNNLPVTLMNVNTTRPIQKISSFGESFDDPKPFSWNTNDAFERESSPPMPSIPPPPPPAIDPLEEPSWTEDDLEPAISSLSIPESASSQEQPYAIALFDYCTDHPDDLSFTANTRIALIRRESEEWLLGSLSNGSPGLFPANYVEIKVPLPHDSIRPALLGTAVALYDFVPTAPGDLRFAYGDTIQVSHKINDEWYFGECHGARGQFPANYVQMNNY